MNLQQTIEELDRLVRWGYNRGKIGGKMLEGFQNAITSLNEMNDTDAKESVADSEVSRVVGELQQLRTVARITGLTPKALAYMKDTNDEFMEWFSVYGFTIKNDTDFEAFLSLRRGFDRLCIKL
jgi:hypothetical protein